MPLVIESTNFADAWMHLLQRLFYHGEPASPRGQGIKEIRYVQLTVHDGLANILQNDIRQINYKFMVAEWLWIWFGHQDVATIRQYNKIIANFSDDGVKFNGAYGPKIIAQWPQIEGLLRRDMDTRQAVVQIYAPQFGETRDVPCTLAVQFMIRRGLLETCVLMRSSDIWLGLPYDYYNFSQLANIMASSLGVGVGKVVFHLGSSHLYAKDDEKAGQIVLKAVPTQSFRSPRFTAPPPPELDVVLKQGFNSFRELVEPWRSYADILTEPKTEALNYLVLLQDHHA